MASSVTIEGLHAGYGAVRVIDDVSISVAPAETVVLLGTNGNGKSTIMKCIMGMVRPSAGTVTAEIDGVRHDLAKLTTEQIVDLGIALVPEGRRLFPKLTVEENLLLGAFRKSARLEMARNLASCFETFPRLAERRSQLAGSMSGGEQQMLALGRALMLAPKILLVDEPSVGLAPILVSRLIARRHVASVCTSGTFNAPGWGPQEPVVSTSSSEPLIRTVQWSSAGGSSGSSSSCSLVEYSPSGIAAITSRAWCSAASSSWSRAAW